jgi:hypothetical protein
MSLLTNATIPCVDERHAATRTHTGRDSHRDARVLDRSTWARGIVRFDGETDGLERRPLSRIIARSGAD